MLSPAYLTRKCVAEGLQVNRQLPLVLAISALDGQVQVEYGSLTFPPAESNWGNSFHVKTASFFSLSVVGFLYCGLRVVGHCVSSGLKSLYSCWVEGCWASYFILNSIFTMEGQINFCLCSVLSTRSFSFGISQKYVS